MFVQRVGSEWENGGVVRLLANVRVRVVVDGRESAEEKAADVGEDGGAAGRDASLGEKFVEGAEGVVDALHVLEIGGLLGEGFEKVNGFLGLQRLAGMKSTAAQALIAVCLEPKEWQRGTALWRPAFRPVRAIC